MLALQFENFLEYERNRQLVTNGVSLEECFPQLRIPQPKNDKEDAGKLFLNFEQQEKLNQLKGLGIKEEDKIIRAII